MDSLGQSIGLALFAICLVTSFAAVFGVARERGLLRPVLVGGVLRLAVTAAAHVVAVLAGDDGFQYLDDRGYSRVGETLAAQWRSGDTPSLLEPLGILPHGGALFYQLAGFLTLVTGDSVIPLKLVNVLFGTLTVLLAALLAHRVLGPRLARPTAWVVALAPTIVWWTAPMLREPLIAVLLMGTLLAASHLPSWRALGLVAGGLALLSLARFAIFAAAGLAVCGYLAALAVTAVRRERRIGPALTPVAALVALGLLTAGLGVVVLSPESGAGTVVEAGVAQGREENRATGGAATVGGEDSDAFASPLANRLAGDLPTETVVGLVRFGFSPRAWAFADQPLDFYQPLYPAMWLWYAVVPIALLGLWRLRRRPEVLLLIGPVVLAAVIYSLTLTSGVRQRSSIEPLLALLVVAGYTTPRTLFLSAAAALGLVAPFAAIDLASAWVGIAVALAAAAVAAATLRLTPSDGRRVPRFRSAVPRRRPPST